MDDGRSGAVENEKDHHYVGMPKSWEARNNHDMNQKLGYNNMADLANTAHPATKMMGAKANKQLGPESVDNDYNYNADR